MIKKTPTFGVIICFFISILIFMYNKAYAAPSIVYRMDKRPPSEIFKHGFKTWGDNDNLFEHVEGISMGITDGSGSAFVSTTSDLQYAIEFAQAVRLEEFYIYEIRATDNFYSLNITFTHFAQTDPGYNEILYNFASSNEFAAYHGISNSQIIRATLYTVQNNETLPGQVFENELYQYEVTTANSSPYNHMYPAEEETIFSGIYDCANHTYAKSKKRDLFPFFKKMLYCYNESQENTTPRILSVLPKNFYFANKDVTVTFSPNEFEIKYPSVKYYRIYYKQITKGEFSKGSSFIDIPAQSKKTLYEKTITIDNNMNDFGLWVVTILAINFDDVIIDSNGKGYPKDNEESNLAFLASSLYSTSPDGWFQGGSVSNSKAICQNNQVMLGRSHWGDENAIVYYRCVYLFLNGQLAKSEPDSLSKIKIIESSGAFVECPGNSLIVGIEHNGDENGQTIYTCANFYLGNNKKREVRVISRLNSVTLSESNHQFSCGSNGQDQGEGGDHSMPPPSNLALAGRAHEGDENGGTKYQCASLAE